VNHGGGITLNPPTLSDNNYEFQSWDCGSVSSAASTFAIGPVNTNLDCVAKYVRPQYKLGVVVTPARAGTLTQPCSNASSCSASVLKGETPAVAVTPTQGFVFNGWSGCSVEDTSALSTKLKPAAGDQTCTATFVAQQYKLSVTTLPAGINAITAPCASSSCSGVYAGGSTPTITVNPTPANYMFRRWSGCSVADASSASTTLSPMLTDQSCVAEFDRITRTVTTRIDQPVGAAALGTADCVKTPCQVLSGDSITLTAKPINDAIATFVGWSVCSTSMAPTITLTVNSDLACVATFRTKQADLVVSEVTPISVARDPSGALNLQVSLRVVVANRGDAPATASATNLPKVAVLYGANRTVTAFTVRGENDPSFPRLSVPIAAGATVTLEGVARVPFAGPNQPSATLYVEADSCRDLESPPAGCRVQESNEQNNESKPVAVSL
jgi:hypothetical protein